MNCAISDLSIYVPTEEMPWNRQRGVHLYRRIMLGANVDIIEEALNTTPSLTIDSILQEAKNQAFSEVPAFAEKKRSEYGLALLESYLEKDGYGRQWIIDLQNFGLRGRMELFWHNHFVTKFDVYESSSYLYQYHKLLQTHALGNFKTFVREIGLNPAMLVFLNGTKNGAGSPNENYAREVYELFTLGVDNGYTQQDIVETARAFTGYTNIPEEWGPVLFNPDDHDNGEKSIFGRTGNWGYDDVIDILFEERELEIASYIATKLYKHFINPEIDEEIIAGLAQVFLESDWSIEAVISTLFKSAHFFDEKNISTIIPGHIEHNLIFFNEFGTAINGLNVLSIYADSVEHGQALFHPVDVAGWPGNRSWINTESIAYRWNYIESQIGSITFFRYNAVKEMITKITDEVFDVEIICRDIIHYFLPQGLQFEADYEEALVNFKGQTPQNYFEDGTWTVEYWAIPFQLNGLFKFINRIPEYQLK